MVDKEETIYKTHRNFWKNQKYTFITRYDIKDIETKALFSKGKTPKYTYHPYEL